MSEDKELHREHVQREMEVFLKNGGRIQKIPSGVSGANALKSKGHASTWARFFQTD